MYRLVNLKVVVGRQEGDCIVNVLVVENLWWDLVECSCRSSRWCDYATSDGLSLCMQMELYPEENCSPLCRRPHRPQVGHLCVQQTVSWASLVLYPLRLANRGSLGSYQTPWLIKLGYFQLKIVRPFAPCTTGAGRPQNVGGFPRPLEVMAVRSSIYGKEFVRDMTSYVTVPFTCIGGAFFTRV